jgi:hypothetical protein
LVTQWRRVDNAHKVPRHVYVQMTIHFTGSDSAQAL